MASVTFIDQEDEESEQIMIIYQSLCEVAKEKTGAAPTWGFVRSGQWNSVAAVGIDSNVSCAKKPDSEVVTEDDFAALLFQSPKGRPQKNSAAALSESDAFFNSLNQDITSPQGIGEVRRTATHRWGSLHERLGLPERQPSVYQLPTSQRQRSPSVSSFTSADSSTPSNQGVRMRDRRSSTVLEEATRRSTNPRLLDVLRLLDQQQAIVDTSMEENRAMIERMTPPVLPDKVAEMMKQSVVHQMNETEYKKRLDNLNEARQNLAHLRAHGRETMTPDPLVEPFQQGKISSKYADQARRRHEQRAASRNSSPAHSLSNTFSSIPRRQGSPVFTPSRAVTPTASSLSATTRTAHSTFSALTTPSAKEKRTHKATKKAKPMPGSVARREIQLAPNKFYTKTDQTVDDETQLVMWLQGQPRNKILALSEQDSKAKAIRTKEKLHGHHKPAPAQTVSREQVVVERDISEAKEKSDAALHKLDDEISRMPRIQRMDRFRDFLRSPHAASQPAGMLDFIRENAWNPRFAGSPGEEWVKTAKKKQRSMCARKLPMSGSLAEKNSLLVSSVEEAL